MARRRPIYSPEFRAEAMRGVRSRSEPLSRMARELGVAAGHPESLGRGDAAEAGDAAHRR